MTTDDTHDTDVTVPHGQDGFPHDSEVGLNRSRQYSHTQINVEAPYINKYSLPIFSAACSNTNFEGLKRMPVLKGLVGKQKVSVLRDSGCSGVVVKQCLVKPSELTSREVTCILIDRSLRRTPIAIVRVGTPYFTGKVEAICMPNPLYGLILGNITGVRAADNPDRS